MNNSRFIKLFSRIAMSVCIILLLASLGNGQEVKFENIRSMVKYIDGGRYKWTVYIKADEATLRKIEKVEYTLYPTFPKPKRKLKTIGDKDFPFAITDEAQKEFNIRIKITYHKVKDATYFDFPLKLTGTN